MRLLPIRELELIWLRRVFLPALLVFYCATLFLAAGGAIGWVTPLEGTAHVVSLALVGHLAAAIVLAAQSIVGAAVLRGLGFAQSSARPVERWLFAIVAGFAAFDVLLLGLALADALRPPVVACFFGLALGAACLSERSELAKLRALFHLATARRRPWVVLAGICALVSLVAWAWPLLVQTALPNTDWDSALYHLPLAERYLDGEVWNRDPLFSANSFPGGVSLVYAALIGSGLEHAIIPYNFLFVLLNLVAVHALANRLGPPRSGAWAVLLCAGIHVLWQQGVDPRVDGFLSLFVVTAMLALVLALREDADRGALYALALSLGCAIGTKYTGLFIAFAFAGLLVAEWLRRQRVGEGLPSMATLALGLALVCVPHVAWYASNTLIHGDPLFPMLRGDYYTLTESPGERHPMTGAFDGKWTELSQAARIQTRQLSGPVESQAPRHLFDWIDLYRRPHAYATKPNHFVSPLLLLFFGLPFARARDPGQRRGMLALAAITVVCFVGLASQTNLVRYTLPFLVLASTAGGIVLARISHPAWNAAWIAAGLVVIAGHHPAEVRKLERLHPDRFAAANGDHLEWLKQVGYNFTPAMPIVVDRINRAIDDGEIAPTSRILMVGEGKARLLACDSLPDLSWFMQRWLVELVRADFDPGRVLGSLRAQGISHILYNPGYFRWVVAHTDTPAEQLAFTMAELESFTAAHGVPVLRVAGMQLFALEDAGGREGS